MQTITYSNTLQRVNRFFVQTLGLSQQMSPVANCNVQTEVQCERRSDWRMAVCLDVGGLFGDVTSLSLLGAVL